MRASLNRDVIAARATQSGRTGANPSTRPGINISARTSTIVTATGHVKRTTCAPMTPAQRNSEGKRSEWNASMYYWTDPAWSRTVSNKP